MIILSPAKSFRRSEGVALVVTLIMLALVTVLAVAFLATTRRERSSVDVTVQQHDARQMADAAAARAIAQVISRMVTDQNNNFVPPQDFSVTNLLNYDFFVSTNFDGGQFWHSVSGAPNALAIANLTNDARVPVFLRTNLNSSAFPLDFRFYLDLNRNGTFDTNGVDPNGNQRIWGDPEWLGLLEYTGQAHSRSNRFIGRYAFMVLPSGKSLDLNYVHNYAKQLNIGMGNDSYLRNHGFGNWEYNLAGFLADLNPNFWFYTNYLTNLGAYSGSGVAPLDAFISANELLRYRYSTNSTNPLPIGWVNTNFAFDLANIPGNVLDVYATGPFASGSTNPYPAFQNDNTNASWPGSPNPRHFWTMEELVDANNAPRYPTFQQQLQNAMTNVNPSLFDHATFYRMLAQMGTDSAAEPRERIVRNDTNHFYFNGNLVTISNLDGHDFRVGEFVRVLGLGEGPYSTGPIGDGTFPIVRTHTNWIEYSNVFPAAVYNPGVTNNPFQPPSGINLFPYGPSNLYVRVSRNNKINLNYNNLRFHETNYVPWAAINGGNIEFFYAVADRLVRSFATDPSVVGVPNYISLTNIPIWHEPSGTNHYTAKVHQMLQVAANLFDASGNSTNPPIYPDRPTIFVPVISPVVNGTNTDVYIVGWTTNQSAVLNFSNFVDIRLPSVRAALTNNSMAFGQPCVVGAKKGWPNFNELSTVANAQINRKLGFAKANTNDAIPNQINQHHLLQLGNEIGAEVWNSYTNPFPRPLQLQLVIDSTMVLLYTNTTTTNKIWPPGPPTPTNVTLYSNIAAFAWGGAVIQPGKSAALSNSFRVIQTNVMFLSNSLYMHNGGVGSTFSSNISNFQTNQGAYIPDWTFVATNRLRLYLFETDAAFSTNSRVLVDFVNITNIERMSILQELMRAKDPNISRFWDTNAQVAIPGITAYQGIRNQIDASVDPGTTPGSPYANTWNSYYNSTVPPQSRPTSANKFSAYLQTGTGVITKDAPFNPFARVFRKASYQANDPLVHYMVDDLADPTPTANRTVAATGRVTNAPLAMDNLYRINERYMPWGGNRAPLGPPVTGGNPTNDFYKYRVGLKDPLVRWSDEWDFPTNKYGNIGWIGRVHRGTPWQTIYLKAGAEETNAWFGWAGNPYTQPTNDWALADMFTVAVDPAARRALLSLNQTNVAAWSALLSGVGVQVNNAGAFNSEQTFTRPVINDYFINANSPELYTLHTNIHGYRATNLPGGVFTNLAQFLALPVVSLDTSNAANTINSPFLFNIANATDWPNNGLTDAAIERLPQQLLSLVTVEENPRVVVYAWGQSLRPADNSIVISPLNPSTHLLCTNYQITGEVATRSVVRFERRVNSVLGTTNLVPVVESYQVLSDP